MTLCAPSVHVVNASRLVSSGAAAARDLAAMADEHAAATCLICMDSISQDEESRTLRCMHVYHEERFGNYEQNANMLYSDGVLKCPGCSLTRGAAADRQTEMLAGAQPAINVSDSSGDIEEIIDDTVPASLPPADPVVETLANGEASPAEPEAAAANGETSPAEPDAAAFGETSPTEPLAAAPGGRPLLAEGGSQGAFWRDATWPCKLCGSECALDRLKISGKTSGRICTCKSCTSKYSMLQRSLGGWPPAFWGQILDEDKQQFWSNPSTKCEDLCRDLKRIETQVETHKKYSNFEGEFQPLSYWKSIGYDVEMIERNAPPEMQGWNPQLGQCYKVKVHKVGEQHSRGTDSREVTEGLFASQVVRSGSDRWRHAHPSEVMQVASSASGGGASSEVASAGVAADAIQVGHPDGSGDDNASRRRKRERSRSSESSSSDSSSADSKQKLKKDGEGKGESEKGHCCCQGGCSQGSLEESEEEEKCRCQDKEKGSG